jgi:uncharacterized protein (DUF608 family)
MPTRHQSARRIPEDGAGRAARDGLNPTGPPRSDEYVVCADANTSIWPMLTRPSIEYYHLLRTTLLLHVLQHLSPCCSEGTRTMALLFDMERGGPPWQRFWAEGLSSDVTGCVFEGEMAARRGMPLGGVGTGCVDLETDGTLGNCTVFGSLSPRRVIGQSFLGISVGDETRLLSTVAASGVKGASGIRYWGHYPVADLEYDLDLPLDVALRAWAPFVVGDVRTSATPAAIFEVRVRNGSAEKRRFSLGMTFPGPSMLESGGLRVIHTRLEETGLSGVVGEGGDYGVFEREPGGENPYASYVLAVLDEDPENVRIGGPLNHRGEIWSRFAHSLPTMRPTDFGSSLVVDAEVESKSTRIVRLLLAWWTPGWRGSGSAITTGNHYANFYTTWFKNAREVASFVSRTHESLMRRILAAQSEVFADSTLPNWLQDSLINVLHLITEDSVWARSQPPLPTWVDPAYGLFAMNESPEVCPQLECLPCSFYGNFPIIYFFPELAVSTARAYAGYMSTDGAAPWIFGGITGGTGAYDLVSPTTGYQVTSNGPCLVDMIDRLWICLRDRELLEELYPAVRAVTRYTMDLNRGPAGVISFPDRLVSVFPPGDKPLGETEWFEACNWAGMAAHVGGLHLAMLQMAGRMAEEVSDFEFATACRQWLESGQRSMEEEMWVGNSYLNQWDQVSGRKSDLVMANQLDGEWMSRAHGLPGVFRADRCDLVLETVGIGNVSHTGFGAVNFVRRDGGVPDDQSTGYPASSVYVAEVIMLGMTYCYLGRPEFGLELVRRLFDGIVHQNGLSWDMPAMIDGQTGDAFFGRDYYQAMILWTLPAALMGTPIDAPMNEGGLVARVLAAASASTA